MPAYRHHNGQEVSTWRRLWTWVDKDDGERYLGILFVLVFIVAIPCIVAASIIVWYINTVPPVDEHLWAAVMEVHPDAGIECHAAMVDRIDHMTGVIYGGPYAVEDSAVRPSRALAEELAVGVVLDSDWRPPEC